MSGRVTSRSLRIKPRDPLTNAPFTGDIDPGARIDAAALTIQEQYVPLANFPDNRYQVSVPDPLQTDEGTIKVDHHFTDRMASR